METERRHWYGGRQTALVWRQRDGTGMETERRHWYGDRETALVWRQRWYWYGDRETALSLPSSLLVPSVTSVRPRKLHRIECWGRLCMKNSASFKTLCHYLPRRKGCNYKKLREWLGIAGGTSRKSPKTVKHCAFLVSLCSWSCDPTMRSACPATYVSASLEARLQAGKHWLPVSVTVFAPSRAPSPAPPVTATSATDRLH